jgi:hypothetical protein
MALSDHPVLQWLSSGGVVLGLAISIYTIYSFVEARLEQKRKQYALLKHINSEFEYFIALSTSLGQRAREAESVFADSFTQLSFPNPARDEDSLPAEAERLSRWLVARAKHLMDYEIPIEIENVGAILNRKQADALFLLLEARRGYIQVLSTRTIDLGLFPRRPGVLKRFVGVAVLNVDPMRAHLKAFAESLGHAGPAETNADSSGRQNRSTP